MKCPNCGASLEDGTRFCNNCGKAADGSDYTVHTDGYSGGDQDVQQNKVLAAIAYIGPLCFVPYFGAKGSAFAQYHGVRGVNFFILCVITWVAQRILAFIPIVGWIINVALWIAEIYLMVTGIITAANGQRRDLPWIGGVRFIQK